MYIIGKYAPQSEEGLRLLVHEMQHVLQYLRGERLVYLEDRDAMEAEAYRAESVLDEESLHNLSGSAVEDAGIPLNPAGGFGRVPRPVLARRSDGFDGNLDDFNRRGEVFYRIHFKTGKTYVVNKRQRETIIEIAARKVEEYVEEKAWSLSEKERDEFLFKYLKLLVRQPV